MSSELGTIQPVSARFWPWLEPFPVRTSFKPVQDVRRGVEALGGGAVSVSGQGSGTCRVRDLRFFRVSDPGFSGQGQESGSFGVSGQGIGSFGPGIRDQEVMTVSDSGKKGVRFGQ